MKYTPVLCAVACLLPHPIEAQTTAGPQTPQPLADSRQVPLSSRLAPRQSLSGGFIYFPRLAGNNPIVQIRHNESLLPQPGKVGDAALTTAQLSLEVPFGADVWVQGRKIDPFNGKRLFQSPPMPVGKRFVFEVRVKWTENGRVVDQTDRLELSAGEKKGLLFFGITDASRKPAPKGGES